MQMNSLQDLYVHKLQDLYSAETQITQALPQMIEKVQNAELKQGMQMHLQQTQQHVQRLEQIMQKLGQQPGGVECQGMKGLIREGQEVLQQPSDQEVLEAGLIAAQQGVEHYEIAGYGCLCTYAELLGYDHAHDLLGQTLDDEETIDQKLTELTESVFNPQAVEGEWA